MFDISIIFLHPNNRLLDPVSTALYLGTLGQGHWCKVLALYGHIYGLIYIWPYTWPHMWPYVWPYVALCVTECGCIPDNSFYS